MNKEPRRGYYYLISCRLIFFHLINRTWQRNYGTEGEWRRKGKRHSRDNFDVLIDFQVFNPKTETLESVLPNVCQQIKFSILKLLVKRLHNVLFEWINIDTNFNCLKVFFFRDVFLLRSMTEVNREVLSEVCWKIMQCLQAWNMTFGVGRFFGRGSCLNWTNSTNLLQAMKPTRYQAINPTSYQTQKSSLPSTSNPNWTWSSPTIVSFARPTLWPNKEEIIESWVTRGIV
jgi:hypothetical protein